NGTGRCARAGWRNGCPPTRFTLVRPSLDSPRSFRRTPTQPMHKSRAEDDSRIENHEHHEAVHRPPDPPWPARVAPRKHGEPGHVNPPDQAKQIVHIDPLSDTRDLPCVLKSRAMRPLVS